MIDGSGPKARNKWKRMNSLLRRFAGARQGNIALSFALLCVPLTVAVGSSLDYVEAMNTQRRMQADLDAALLTAAQTVDVSDKDALKAEVVKWVEAESVTRGFYKLNTADILIDKTTSTIAARMSADVPTVFMQIIGWPTIPVAVVSTAIGGKNAVTQNAFSMYLVLDRSGSMDYDSNSTYTTTCRLPWGWTYQCTKSYTKMESLQMAVGDLMGQLKDADPDEKYVRTAAISYNQSAQTPVDFDWGESHVSAYVDALVPSGNTDSSRAFKTAYLALNNSTEDNQHKSKNGLVPSKFIVFMTDGANNVDNADRETKKWCDNARKKDIVVYTVAFMAPEQGQSLLKYCANTDADYFEAENTAELIAAFKSIGQTASKTAVRLTQ